MFVAIVLVCGLPQGNLSCQALVNATPMTTVDECYMNIQENIEGIAAGLPPGGFVSDFECVPMSIAG